MSLRQQSWMAWPARAAICALRTWALAFALLCLASRGFAQPEPERGTALIANYTAHSDCPDRREFERRVRARLSAATPHTRSMRFDVRLEHTPGGARGTLSLVGQSGGARELSAASCAEAADALALVAALMLGDPGTEARASEPARADARAKRRPEPRNSERVSSPASGGDQETPPTSSADAGDEAETAAASSPESKPKEDTLSTIPTSSADVSAPMHAPRERFFSDWRVHVGAGGLLLWGMAPQLRAGANIMAKISARAHGTGPRYALGLAARAAYPHQLRIPEGKAKFRWAALATSLCVEGPERRLSVSGCALLETGWLEGSSSDGQAPRQRSRFWGALGPALALDTLLHARVGVRLGGELLGVLVRDRFFLADRRLYSVPRLAFRAELSLYFPVW